MAISPTTRTAARCAGVLPGRRERNWGDRFPAWRGRLVEDWRRRLLQRSVLCQSPGRRARSGVPLRAGKGDSLTATGGAPRAPAATRFFHRRQIRGQLMLSLQVEDDRRLAMIDLRARCEFLDDEL